LQNDLINTFCESERGRTATADKERARVEDELADIKVRSNRK